MNRDRSVSAHSPNYSRRRAIAATVTVVLALCAAYGLFLGTAAFMVVLGFAA
ncbi:hypothetical protein [Williamsia muralis]|uniref:hypothetical protein n=1 Tax=Williamsia marianensis TaxID=85044 RepID=UPI00166F99BC|nr:hypothetical protein [Williamsia marianensis]